MPQYDSFVDVIVDLRATCARAGETRQLLEDRNLEPADARQLALRDIRSDLSTCASWIHALLGLQDLCRDHFGDDWEENYLLRLGTEHSRATAETRMLDYLRTTVVAKVHFSIDNLFHNILAHVRRLPRRRGFWYLSTAVLELAGVDPEGSEKKTLSVLANLRNSLHANGIHNNEDLHHVIGAMKYEFLDGEPVRCASWAHVVAALHGNVCLLDRLFRTPRLQRLREAIPDAAAKALTDP